MAILWPSLLKTGIQTIFEALCVKLGVPDQKKFGEYSKGMKMKIGIAVAMSHHPKLLILDEGHKWVGSGCER